MILPVVRWIFSFNVYALLCAFFGFTQFGLAAEIKDSKIRNPFLIDCCEKTRLDEEDYSNLSEKLSAIDLRNLLTKLYSEFGHRPHSSFEKFLGRCSRGLHQAFFDPVRGKKPLKSMVVLNGGGEDCVISSVPYAKDYPDLLQDQIIALEKLGFRGTFIAYFGAIPTPTGEEPQLAGVPYAWKIFALREAFQLGHRRVLWVDAALYPLRDLSPLFEEIEQHGFVTHSVAPNRWKWGYETVPAAPQRGWGRHIFPATRRLLHSLTGVDVLTRRHFIAAAFGMRADHPCTQPFLERFYEMARMGTPFLSELPEEFVISAILGERPFELWSQQLERQATEHKFFFDVVGGDPPGAWDRARREGCFFFWRQHRHPDLVDTPARGR
jgi:hypothetical protein